MSDTIVALSTPSGESAIGVIRICGGEVARLAAETLGAAPQPRRAVKASYTAAEGGKLDDVVAVFFKAPASYTDRKSVV